LNGNYRNISVKAFEAFLSSDLNWLEEVTCLWRKWIDRNKEDIKPEKEAKESEHEF
jgi:hypothetical protein